MPRSRPSGIAIRMEYRLTRQFLRHHFRHAEGLIHLLADAPVPPGEDRLQKQHILHQKRPVVSHLLSFGVDQVDVPAHLAHRRKRQHLDQYKTERHDHKHGQKHEQDSLYDVFLHGTSVRGMSRVAFPAAGSGTGRASRGSLPVSRTAPGRSRVHCAVHPKTPSGSCRVLSHQYWSVLAAV